MINILFTGDIVGRPGRRALKELLPVIRSEEKIDFVIANGENAAGGSGVTLAICEELFGYGVNVITTGDHIWKRKEVAGFIDKEPRLLRPANYPENTPGSGSGVFEIPNGGKLGIINIMGRVFMQAIDCPFRKATAIINDIKKQTDVIVVDMHAEATSEKIAMSRYLDGLVCAVCGSHTHVQTADEVVLPKGTAYITDLGMTGPHDSVIGRRTDQILTRFITQMPARFEVAENDVRLEGAVVCVDEKTAKATAIKRIQKKLD
jgi:hypothetical protein